MHHRHVTHLLLCLLSVGFSAAQSELETDEVIPRLLSAQDAHLSARRRGHRSLDAPGAGHSDPGSSNSILILTLPAFGTELHLNLTRDNTFLSRDFVVEERRAEQSAAVTRVPPEQLCFYSGSIINHTDSVVSVNTCGGLTGLVQIGEETLFIQPLEESDPSIQSFSGRKHRLSRHRRSSDGEHEHDFCGTRRGILRFPKQTVMQPERMLSVVLLHTGTRVEEETPFSPQCVFGISCVSCDWHRR